MKKTIKRLSILLGIAGIGMILLAGILNLSSIIWIIGMMILIVGALTGVFLAGNGENTIGSYRSPRI